MMSTKKMKFKSLTGTSSNSCTTMIEK